jgi:acetyltransferase-like isoleucine patch superfamily enzyme
MKLSEIVRRFFIPTQFVTLYYYCKFRCFISPRAEVELSTKLSIGKKSRIGSFTKLKAGKGPVVIGENVTIGEACHIGAGAKGTVIGNDCIIGPHVLIIGVNYRYTDINIPFRLQGITNKGITIQDNVWIGTGSCILDGSIIESGSIITPNSVVSGKIPENSIAQGNPAKVIFTRR